MENVINLLRENIMLREKEISHKKSFMEIYPNNMWKESTLKSIEENEKFVLILNEAIKILSASKMAVTSPPNEA